MQLFIDFLGSFNVECESHSRNEKLRPKNRFNDRQKVAKKEKGNILYYTCIYFNGYFTVFKVVNFQRYVSCLIIILGRGRIQENRRVKFVSECGELRFSLHWLIANVINFNRELFARN